MDLTGRLLRHTLPRPLVAAMPGGTGARLAVERLVRERGWPAAAGPGEANLLVVAGTPAAEAEPYVARVRDAMPMPCVRLDVEAAPAAEQRLDTAVAALSEGGRVAPAGPAPPAELPMADRAEDRDGLKLDRLHVPLGPVLPEWPAGLVVRTALQGDVIQEAEVRTLRPPRDRQAADVSPWTGPAAHAARRLDACARVLAVAGWRDAAATARRFRDRLLEGTDQVATVAPMTTWARRVRRSWTLRWMLRGVGAVRPAAGLYPPAPPGLAGDTWDRLDRWLAEAVAGLGEPGLWRDGRQVARAAADEAAWTLEALPRLLPGAEFAAARLVVAGLDPDLDALVAEDVPHG